MRVAHDELWVVDVKNYRQNLSVRLCYEKEIGSSLYCSQDGRFFHLQRHQKTPMRYVLTEVQPCYGQFNPNYGKNSHRSHGHPVPFMRNFGNKKCHLLVATAWLGTRPDGYQCDHLNTDTRDFKLPNLEWVTPAENRRRAKVIRYLRTTGRDPKTISYGTLRLLIERYRDDPDATLSHLIANS